MNFSRPLYQEDAIVFKWDSSLTTDSVTATNYHYCGANSWTLAIPSTAGISGNITIQGNNANPLDRSQTGVRYTVNPLLMQPSMGYPRGVLNQIGNSPTFTANWVNVATINSGVQFRSINDVPMRYIRLSGDALTAANFSCFMWTDSCVQGN